MQGSILVVVDTSRAEPAVAPSHTRRELSPPTRNAIAAVLILAALAGLVLTVQAAVTGDDDTSRALPDSVERLLPESGSEVLTQSTVGVDLAVGYDAYLIINGTEIRDEEGGLFKDMGTGLVTYQPGAGEIEELEAEKNCVIAMVWDQTEGPKFADPVSWCFTAA
jgi:hypothetical protein